MLNFCTLFDSNYLSRGLVTYQSLMLATHNTVHLYVFAFDDLCLDTLSKMQLPNLTVIALADFEDDALLAIKPTRSRGEYCWTCTSSTILYCLQKYNLENCIYIDADMYFYNDPRVLIDEKPATADVIITEHRYTPQYDKSKLSGIYCVQFMYFKNNAGGLKVLNWWRDRCLEWCYNRHEDGKFGDQKYLDDWTIRFVEEVHVCRNLGAGLAPWNIQQFLMENTEGVLQCQVKSQYRALPFNTLGLEQAEDFKPVFFHFHGVKLYENGAAIYAPKMYILNKIIRQTIYEPYLKALQLAQEELTSFDPSLEKKGYLSSKEYSEDRKKGWGAFIKTNVFNRLMLSIK